MFLKSNWTIQLGRFNQKLDHCLIRVAQKTRNAFDPVWTGQNRRNRWNWTKSVIGSSFPTTSLSWLLGKLSVRFSYWGSRKAILMVSYNGSNVGALFYFHVVVLLWRLGVWVLVLVVGSCWCFGVVAMAPRVGSSSGALCSGSNAWGRLGSFWEISWCCLLPFLSQGKEVNFQILKTFKI